MRRKRLRKKRDSIESLKEWEWRENGGGGGGLLCNNSYLIN